MIKAIAFLLVILALLGSLNSFSQSPPPPPSPGESSQAKQDIRAVESDRTENENSQAQPTVTNINQFPAQPQRDAIKSETTPNADNTTPINWSDWIIAGFTGILTIVGILQYLAMRQQAGYMTVI